MQHLYSCFDSMYAALGESAPMLHDDAFVIRTYEMARACGEVALTFRDYLGDVADERILALDEVLLEAIESDESGAMVLFAMATLIGPRVLVSLRDAREVAGLDDSAKEVLSAASQMLVREILLAGEVTKTQASTEDDRWPEIARRLSVTLEESGNAESFGISR
ncbi:MAG TPA: hypothetical protein VII67_00465 [Acidimicrobiales bacterium]